MNQNQQTVFVVFESPSLGKTRLLKVFSSKESAEIWISEYEKNIQETKGFMPFVFWTAETVET